MLDYNPRAEEDRQVSGAHWSASLAYLVSSMPLSNLVPKNKMKGAGKMAQQLRELDALAAELSLVLVLMSAACSSSSGGSEDPSHLWSHLHAYAQEQEHTDTSTHIFFLKKR